MFENYKDCFLSNTVILGSQQRFKSDHHDVYTEEVNKIALSCNDNKSCKHLIELQQIHTEQMLLKCVKVKGDGKIFILWKIIMKTSVTTTIKKQKITNVNINDQFWWLC